MSKGKGGPLNYNLPNSIMVVGTNTRPIVKSAKSIGMRTIAVDGFGDLDLRRYADTVYSPKTPKPEGPGRGRDLLIKSLSILEKHEVDAVLLSSGTEHWPGLIKRIKEKIDVIGNKETQIGTCTAKKRLFTAANKIGIPTPSTRRVSEVEDALEFADEAGYPVLLKPSFGGGGIGIRIASSPDRVLANFSEVLSSGNGRSAYVQKYIKGIDASTSVLSNGERAQCLTVNEQIVGDARLGVPRPLGYCGNVLPLEKNGELSSKLAEFSEALCEELGLVGSNGVDFVVSDRPYLVEVNPRFQGTIDCVEGVLGINLVEKHIEACRGELGDYKKPEGYSIKLILYAKEDMVAPDLDDLPVVDVPMPGSSVKKGSPLCSILKFGNSRKKLVQEAYRTAEKIYRFVQTT
ncbi:hypothetical protein AKJ43_02550 [candidate division MSBL1 archaeon SCGC-AAA261D19]|uniref:ATP-grasp domain-containing protein n=1 Tax=candidate division MSBL1 archaeon SCGC-AAA261D19 TaxID=1698273 RepID=A0A133V6K2_9EURY|nr:hypothetical protein AKJ43_02550 [candidate division MSBL1 archaeon SCGC-AAA261D19]